MKQKTTLIGAMIIAGVVAIWYYIRGGFNGPTQLSYPNAGGSGLPAYQSSPVASNFGVLQPAPDPSLIYGPFPPLPATPNYQRFNYAPLNILSLTPEAAQTIPDNTKPPEQLSCCCPIVGAPVFMDGNLDVTVAANPTEQIKASPDPMLFDKLRFNLATSAAADPTFTWGQTAKAIGALPEMF